MGSKGGCVILQRFEGKVELDEASDSDHQGSPKKHVKHSEIEIPMVVAIYMYTTSEPDTPVHTTIWRNGIL